MAADTSRRLSRGRIVSRLIAATISSRIRATVAESRVWRLLRVETCGRLTTAYMKTFLMIARLKCGRRVALSISGLAAIGNTIFPRA